MRRCACAVPGMAGALTILKNTLQFVIQKRGSSPRFLVAMGCRACGSVSAQKSSLARTARQHNGESAPLADLALYLDPPAMDLNEFPGDG